MAQFDYSTWKAQQEARQSARTNNPGTREKIHFINSWLTNDGNSVVVRFPYHSMEDIKFESVHTIPFPKEKFNKRVRCEGPDCPLCKQGIKTDTRFFVKAIVYVTDPVNGSVSLLPAIWDRAAAFADIDLKNLISEYGDLSENLFKIKRNGSGLDTRYTISIITNKAVYNPDVYKADFTCLENVDPSKVLTKSIEQYMKAINGETDKPDEEIPTNNKLETPVTTYTTPVVETKPIEQVVTQTPSTPVTQTEPSTQSVETNVTTETKPKRYTF